eukprot:SAG11_NODE_16147_length_555_cov_10.355263_2_plen_74_part_01
MSKVSGVSDIFQSFEKEESAKSDIVKMRILTCRFSSDSQTRQTGSAPKISRASSAVGSTRFLVPVDWAALRTFG